MHPTKNPANPGVVDVEPTPAQTLRAAADYIERHGWHQGAFYPSPYEGATPPACAVGAIRVAVCGRPVIWDDQLTTDERYRTAGAEIVLADHLGCYPMDEDHSPRVLIGNWNDEDWRTGIDVTDALREAADEWDRTHGGAR